MIPLSWFKSRFPTSGVLGVNSIDIDVGPKIGPKFFMKCNNSSRFMKCNNILESHSRTERLFDVCRKLRAPQNQQ